MHCHSCQEWTHCHSSLSIDYFVRQVFTFLKNKRADIIFLQETHCTDNLENIWRSEWGSKAIFSNGTSNSTGVGILFHKDLHCNILNTIKDTNGRILCLDIEIESVRLTVCNLYAPNNDDPDFFKQCIETIDSIENITRIIAGDFNLVMDINLDKKGGKPVTHFKAREVLQTYMNDTDLEDIWRLQHPTDRIYTWKRNKPPIFCRLDMILVSDDIIGNTVKTNISPGYKSDHSVVSIELDLASQPRGKGFWKLNTNLLTDMDYIEKMNCCIDEAIDKYRLENPDIKLELVKMEIAAASIQYSKNKAKSKKNIIEVLSKKLERLDRDFNKETDRYKLDRIKKDMDNTNLELQNLVYEKTKSSMFRCRAKWVEEGEKSSKYFFNLEKANFNKKVMKSTYTSDGTLTTNPNTILNEQSNFFKKLYTRDENVEFNIENNNNPKISDLNRRVVDMDITIEDHKYA